MSESGFTRVASLADLAEGGLQAVQLNGNEVLLCHTAEGVYAVDNLCTHGAARLCDGKLKGHRVLCPMHGGAFDVRDGSALSRPAVQPLASYDVRIEGDDILLALAE